MYFIQDGLIATILSDNVFSLGCPNKRFRIAIVMLNIRFNGGDQFADRSKHPTPNSLVGQIAEPTLDHVEP